MPSFKDTLAKTREVLAESNQQNLSHALLAVEEGIVATKAHLAALEKIEAEINEAGDSEAVLKDASGVVTRELWDRARKLAGKL